MPYFIMENVEGTPITDYARPQFYCRTEVRIVLEGCEGVLTRINILVIHRISNRRIS